MNFPWIVADAKRTLRGGTQLVRINNRIMTVKRNQYILENKKATELHSRGKRVMSCWSRNRVSWRALGFSGESIMLSWGGASPSRDDEGSGLPAMVMYRSNLVQAVSKEYISAVKAVALEVISRVMGVLLERSDSIYP